MAVQGFKRKVSYCGSDMQRDTQTQIWLQSYPTACPEVYASVFYAFEPRSCNNTYEYGVIGCTSLRQIHKLNK